MCRWDAWVQLTRLPPLCCSWPVTPRLSSPVSICLWTEDVATSLLRRRPTRKMSGRKHEERPHCFYQPSPVPARRTGTPHTICADSSRLSRYLRDLESIRIQGQADWRRMGGMPEGSDAYTRGCSE